MRIELLLNSALAVVPLAHKGWRIHFLWTCQLFLFFRLYVHETRKQSPFLRHSYSPSYHFHYPQRIEDHQKGELAKRAEVLLFVMYYVIYVYPRWVFAAHQFCPARHVWCPRSPLSSQSVDRKGISFFERNTILSFFESVFFRERNCFLANR